MNNQNKDILSCYEKEIYLLHLSNSSITLRKRVAMYFLNYLQNNNIKTIDTDIENILNFIRTYENISKFTIRNYLEYVKLFVEFLYSRKYINTPIHLKIPKIKVPKQSKIPSVWEKSDIEKLLATIDRATPIGKRDYAILLLIVKLGLRKIDVISLQFNNINWNNKTININQQKTKEPISLPLTDDIAIAIIDYIKNGRPQCDTKNIFVTHRKNPVAFSKEHGNFYAIVIKYMKKANISINKKKKNGVHSLRHTLASELLKNYTPIETISSILGHVNSNSTSIYLKIDIEKLRECTLEVPCYEK